MGRDGVPATPSISALAGPGLAGKMAEARPTIGFVGLGLMGLSVAAKLIDDGYPVVGCDRGRTAELVELGGEVPSGATAATVAERSDVVLTCLPSEASFEAVVSGPDGIVAAASPPRAVVDLSTISVNVLEAQAEALAGKGIPFVSSPISGTPKMVEVGRATAFASGDREVFESVEGILRTPFPAVAFVGPLGAGASFKYIANLLVAVHAATAAEAMALADRAGLDQALLVELISASPGATSGQFNVRAPMMASEEFVKLGTVDVLRKDLDIIKGFASECGVEAPLFTAAKSLYDEMSARGEGDEDIARMVLMLKAAAGNGKGK